MILVSATKLEEGHSEIQAPFMRVVQGLVLMLSSWFPGIWICFHAENGENGEHHQDIYIRMYNCSYVDI